MKKGSFDKITVFFLSVAAAAVLLTFQGCDGISGKKASGPEGLTAEYHAVFIDNGQVFFGKIKNSSSEFIHLSDVFYIKSEVLKDSSGKDVKEVRSTLIKRGSEWHGPDTMHINSRHITLIEPVSPGSRVGGLIKEASAKTK